MGYKHSREDLLTAAARLAASSGIGSLTFGSVGASLGISDRTVVYYFPTKADMITSVIAALGEQLQTALADAFGEQALPVADHAQPHLIGMQLLDLAIEPTSVPSSSSSPGS